MTINVEVFASPGCSKCGHAKEALRTLVTELGGNSIQWREVNVLEELDHAVNLGILSTPAIVIDGELVFTRLPSIKKLRNELERLESLKGLSRYQETFEKIAGLTLIATGIYLLNAYFFIIRV